MCVYLLGLTCVGGDKGKEEETEVAEELGPRGAKAWPPAKEGHSPLRRRGILNGDTDV